MTPPVQLWIPWFSHSPHVGLDLRRAYGAWKGEDRIWLLPWVRKSFRWNSEVRIRYKRSHAKGAPNNWLLYRFQELAIPSERFDCIDVIYIDSERRFFAAGQDRPPLSEYGSLLPKSIYKQWIQVPAPQFVPSPEWVDFTVPHFRDGSGTFERRPFSPAWACGP